ncbi:Clavaminate synthase-like protein [Pilatotrama ljubarskyi]|nr:Clavaminate synthase-like protein [Pilatotrama ljubarskyi]
MLAVAPSSCSLLPSLRRLAAAPRSCTVSQTRYAARHARRLFATHAEDAFRIPLIDFNKYRNASSTAEKEQTAQDIVRGFTDVGFIYLNNHGIPQETVQQAFQKSAEFFQLPIEKKSELAWRDPRANRGFVQIGRERVTQSADAEEIKRLREKAPDYKESMEIGRDWDKMYKNYWPQEADAPGFKRTMLDFFQTCHELHVQVMRSIALGLKLEETFFDDKIDEQYHNLRLLSYPPIKTQLLKGDGQARAGAHSDYGTLTLLFQDSVGGLEVQNPRTGQFQPATPIPGTIVINAGDLLARWSNDVLRSTLHRVVAPPAKAISDTEGITPARQSIAFFCNPNQGAEISCLPTCLVPGSKPKYPPVTTEEYIVGRLQATYM